MIPLKYNIGNLTARRVSTLMTILGIGVVIAVMISMMALQNGVRSAVVSSGSKDNLMVMREGAAAELSSWVTKDAFRTMRPYVKLVEGRMFRPGLNEVIVARRIRDRFVNAGLGDTFQFGATKYNVV